MRLQFSQSRLIDQPPARHQSCNVFATGLNKPKEDNKDGGQAPSNNGRCRSITINLAKEPLDMQAILDKLRAGRGQPQSNGPPAVSEKEERKDLFILPGEDDEDSLSSQSDYLSERSDRGMSMACPASTFKKRSYEPRSQEAPRQIIDT